MYDEEMYEARPQPRLIPGSEVTELRPCTACPQAYDACADARTRLCRLSSQWCAATCDQIKAKIASDCTIFVGNDPARCALAPGTCGSTCGSGPTPTPTGDNTLLYVAAGGVALVAVIAVVMVAARRPRAMTTPKGGA